MYPSSRSARILLTLIAVAVAAGFAMSSHFYTPAIFSPYFALSLFGVALICWRLTRSWRVALWTLVAGAGVAFELLLSGRTLSLVSAMASLGLGSLLVLGILAIWTEGEERRLLTTGFAGALILVACEYFGLKLLGSTQDANSRVLDLYLYSFDASLHVPIAFLMGQAYQRWVWLNLAGWFFYTGLFIPIAVVYAGLLVRDRQKALEALAAFVLTAPIGVLFYRLFPAVGPLALFLKDFPWHPLGYTETSRLVGRAHFGTLAEKCDAVAAHGVGAARTLVGGHTSMVGPPAGGTLRDIHDRGHDGTRGALLDRPHCRLPIRTHDLLFLFLLAVMEDPSASVGISRRIACYTRLVRHTSLRNAPFLDFAGRSLVRLHSHRGTHPSRTQKPSPVERKRGFGGHGSRAGRLKRARISSGLFLRNAISAVVPG